LNNRDNFAGRYSNKLVKNDGGAYSPKMEDITLPLLKKKNLQLSW